MITEGIFESILLRPAEQGFTDLFVVSGYATPSLGYLHFQRAFEEKGLPIKVTLIYGMACHDGVPRVYHDQFKRLSRDDYPGRFKCLYLRTAPPVHAKTYAWLSRGTPRIGFVGSANYTHSGFFHQREAAVEVDPRETYAHFSSLLDDCVDCLDPRVEDIITFTNVLISRARETFRRKPMDISGRQAPPVVLDAPILISLLDTRGDLPKRSGLNWGQRPELNRNPDQGYIRVPANVAHIKFFPPRFRHFTIVTDDDFSFDAVIAQDGDKAIHTPKDNSIIGRYFRRRLGVPLGALLTAKDLKRYGRSNVGFVKIDEETYYMDFSVRTKTVR